MFVGGVLPIALAIVVGNLLGAAGSAGGAWYAGAAAAAAYRAAP